MWDYPLTNFLKEYTPFYHIPSHKRSFNKFWTTESYRAHFLTTTELKQELTERAWKSPHVWEKNDTVLDKPCFKAEIRKGNIRYF